MVSLSNRFEFRTSNFVFSLPIRNTQYEYLWCEEEVGIVGGNFSTLVYMGVLQREYIVHFGAEPAGFYKFYAAVVEQNVLPATIVIDTVDACQFFVQL